MGFHDFISETEAASLAGISIQTLNRFAETGYLNVEVDSDGLRLFSKSELKNLFNVDLGDVESAENCQVQAQVANGAVSYGREQHSSEQSYFTNRAGNDVIKGSLLKIHPGRTTDNDQALKKIASLEQEVSRLKNIADLLEKLLDIREQELADLRRERDWLRSRVEKLEEKGDRDQLLLLSETQALHRLIMQHDKKRSPLRTALAWFGWTDASGEEQSRTFDIHSTKDKA